MADFEIDHAKRGRLTSKLQGACCRYMYGAGVSTGKGESLDPPGYLEVFAAGAAWACEQLQSKGGADIEDDLIVVASTLSQRLQVESPTDK